VLDPLFILAPGRSYTSLISAMLGQHPQMYGVLELNLNTFDTMDEYWMKYGRRRGLNSSGLLRTVAQIVFGEQNEDTIIGARRWLRRHLDWPTARLHETLLEAVAPKRVVEKCPASVRNESEVLRLFEAFPNAKFLHLVRHPRGTCNSFVQTPWALKMLIMVFPDRADFSTDPPTIDTQTLWYETHLRISNFTEYLPPSQTKRILGESFLADPDRHLRDIAAWLGVRDDDAAIEEMMHPERSPYACLGPRNALGGADIGFLRSPTLRPFTMKAESLDGPLPWRTDGGGFIPEVKELARYFGYN
jgi:hypothetical protein